MQKAILRFTTKAWIHKLLIAALKSDTGRRQQHSEFDKLRSLYVLKLPVKSLTPLPASTDFTWRENYAAVSLERTPGETGFTREKLDLKLGLIVSYRGDKPWAWSTRHFQVADTVSGTSMHRTKTQSTMGFVTGRCAGTSDWSRWGKPEEWQAWHCLRNWRASVGEALAGWCRDTSAVLHEMMRNRKKSCLHRSRCWYELRCQAGRQTLPTLHYQSTPPVDMWFLKSSVNDSGTQIAKSLLPRPWVMRTLSRRLNGTNELNAACCRKATVPIRKRGQQSFWMSWNKQGRTWMIALSAASQEELAQSVVKNLSWVDW